MTLYSLTPDPVSRLQAALAELADPLAELLADAVRRALADNIPTPVVTEDEQVLFSIPQAAEKLAISTDAVYDAIRRRELIAMRVGRIYRIRPEDLRRYVAELPSTADRPAPRPIRRSGKERGGASLRGVAIQ